MCVCRSPMTCVIGMSAKCALPMRVFGPPQQSWRLFWSMAATLYSIFGEVNCADPCSEAFSGDGMQHPVADTEVTSAAAGGIQATQEPCMCGYALT
mmetsp:Transcript_111981/g.280575  ORF Transcript_111981/g.280575 Transcript_111981/m.280575 type:complete len:96 (+) Transcript_111981:316-603(+)